MRTCPFGSESTAKMVAGSAWIVRCTSIRSSVIRASCHPRAAKAQPPDRAVDTEHTGRVATRAGSSRCRLVARGRLVARRCHVEINRVGEFTLGWGESVVWDEQQARLYFVDCLASTLHWLDDGDEPGTWTLPSMPTGIVPRARRSPRRRARRWLVPAGCRHPGRRAARAHPVELGRHANDTCRGSRRQRDHGHAQPRTGRGLGVVVLGR